MAVTGPLEWGYGARSTSALRTTPATCTRLQAKADGLWNLWLPGPLSKGLEHLLPLCANETDR